MCVIQLYPLQLGKTSNYTQICWNHLPKPVPRWQESEAARGELNGTKRQKCYCQHPSKADNNPPGVFCTSCHQGQAERTKKNHCPKGIVSVFERQRKHHNMKWKNWCYHSLNTAEERGYYSQTTPHHLPPPLFAQLFTSPAPLYTPLIDQSGNHS